MTTFREGDVVRWPGCGGEYRVSGVDDHVRVDGLPSAEHTAGGGDPSVFVLLRRPLRVGDVLVRVHDNPQDLDRTVIEQKHLGYPQKWADLGWTHEDGTPIDVEAPAVEAKAPQLAEHPGHADVSIKIVASEEIKNGKLVAIRPDGSVAEHRSFGESVNEALMQRANRLSDECGALASQNRELLVENAQLRRDVERLTRKARR